MPADALLQSGQAMWLFYGTLLLLGLCVGSFLNVVVARLPVMLARERRRHCGEPPGAAARETGPERRFDLARPASHCPACGHALAAWENIPLLGYALLRGRCGHCRAAISPRYPAIELGGGLLALGLGWHFGAANAQLAAALLLSWSLLALAAIDIEEQLLPDAITLPLLWLGLLVNSFGGFATLREAVFGAMAGYLSLWSAYHGFRLLTGKEGMGHGDFKLLAALGAWLGWQALPLVILLSSLSGAAVGIGLVLLRKRRRDAPLPFGPFLAAAGWVALLWGERIAACYWRLAGAGQLP